MTTVRVEAERPATRCALCHDDLVGGEPCPDCGTVTHRECAAEAGCCPTLGCAPRIGEAADLRCRPATERPRRGIGAVQLGLIVGVASLFAGFAIGAVATGCPGHALLKATTLVLLAPIYAFLGAGVASLCRLLERRRHTGEVPVRPVSWSYLPLLLASGAGAAFACWLVLLVEGLRHMRLW